MPIAHTRAYVAAALLSAAATTATAQKSAADDSVVLRRLREETSAHSQVLRTATILSDVFGPRLAGSPNYRAAAEWARGELASYGVASAHLEAWGTRRGRTWTPTRYSVELFAPYYARLVAYPRAWSPATTGVVRGTPVLLTDVRADTDIARYGDRLRGKIVLLGEPPALDTSHVAPMIQRWTTRELDSLARLTDPGAPKDYWEDSGDEYLAHLRARQRVALALGRAGVAVVLTPSLVADAPSVNGYQAYDSDLSGAAPAFVLSRGDYARVVNLVRLARDARQPAPVLALDLATRSIIPRTRDDSIGYDVIAELPGDDPTLGQEVVMAGGHFDSWTAGTGATDNAAGAAVVMEALRLLHAVGARPKRTIRIALWDGEEQEEYQGSMGYVRHHFGDPVTMRLLPEQTRISAYFNIDHGAGRIRGIRLQGNAAARPYLERVLAPLADLGATTVTIANRGETDHMPFVAVGIPAFTFLQDPLDYDTRTHHTNADVAASLFPADLQQAALVTAAVLFQTANLPQLLPRLSAPKPHATH